MGLLDKVRSLGSSVLNKARDVENKVEKTVEKTAVNLAKDAYDIAKNAPAALGAGVEATVSGLVPSKTQVAHAWSVISDASMRFGGALSAAGSTVEAGSKALSPFVPFAGEGVLIGGAVKGLGSAVTAAPEKAVSLVHEAQDLEKKGEAFLHRAEAVADQGIKAAKAGLETVKNGLEIAKNGVTNFVNEVAHAVDYGHNIDELGDNDKYTLAVGGEASVEGIKGYGKGSIEVEKNEKGKYVVSADGELGGGVYGEIGGKIGAKLDAEASATLGVGGKIEMTFDTAEEAKKATGILLKQAASTAVSVEGNQLLPGAGLLAGKALAPSSDEMNFLADHTSAVELGGNVAGEVAGCVGLKDVAGLFGSAKVKDEVAVRIELKDEKGEPKKPELVVKQTATGEAELGAGLKLGGREENGMAAAFAGGKGEASVEVEQRFTLPNVKRGDLLAHPLDTVRNAASSMVKTEKDKVTLGLDVSGQALGSGGGLEVEASYEGNFADLQKSAVAALVKGDVNGALKTLDGKDSLELKFEPYATVGVACSPEISIMGFGVGMEFEATRKDYAEKPARKEWKGSPSELGDKLNKQLRPYIDVGKRVRPQITG